MEIIAWAGHCEVHERFTAAEVRALRAEHPGVVVLAHPECPPEVIAEADYAGSTADMAGYVSQRQPRRVVLLTECSMSDNVAVQNPGRGVRPPVQSLPAHEADHAAEDPPRAGDDAHEVTIDPAIAERARAARWNACWRCRRSMAMHVPPCPR